MQRNSVLFFCAQSVQPSLHNGAAGGMLFVLDNQGISAKFSVCYISDSSDRGTLHVHFRSPCLPTFFGGCFLVESCS